MSPKISKELSKHRIEQKIVESSKIREDSDYDDEFIVDPEKTQEQINTAKKLIDLVEKYIDEKCK